MDNHTDVPNMPDISISQAGIYQLLTSLDEHKASGPDHICDQILENLPFGHKQTFWENSKETFDTF